MAHEQAKVVEDDISSILVIIGSPTPPFDPASAVAAYATRNPAWSRTQVPIICRSSACLASDLELYAKFLAIVFEQQRHLFKTPGILFVQCVFAHARESSEHEVPIGLVTACRAALDDLEIRVVEGPLSFVPRGPHA